MSSNESQTTPAPTVILAKKKGPGCLIQALWFIFIGSWLGAISITIAWLLNVSIIGLPLGMAILNNIPRLLTLKEGETRIRATGRGDTTVITETDLPQRNFLVRTIFFLVIGWWWSGIWLAIGFAFCATVILMPIGFKMFELAPAMTTLKRY